jgi:hypothetical protein
MIFSGNRFPLSQIMLEAQLYGISAKGESVGLGARAEEADFEGYDPSPGRNRGPVDTAAALVNPVRNLDEAIGKANSLPYGLAAYAFTRSAQNANRLAGDIEAGNLSINHFVASVAETPFGGVKDSGYGREGGTEGVQCYTVAKNVSHKMI